MFLPKATLVALSYAYFTLCLCLSITCFILKYVPKATFVNLSVLKREHLTRRCCSSSQNFPVKFCSVEYDFTPFIYSSLNVLESHISAPQLMRTAVIEINEECFLFFFDFPGR